MTEILLTVLLSVALDRFLPDRRGIKPFAWYRDWAESVEERFNGGKRIHGVGAVLLVTVPIVTAFALARYILGELGWLPRFFFDVFMLYLCLNIYRLGKTANTAASGLMAGDLTEANEQLLELTG